MGLRPCPYTGGRDDLAGFLATCGGVDVERGGGGALTLETVSGTELDGAGGCAAGRLFLVCRAGSGTGWTGIKVPLPVSVGGVAGGGGTSARRTGLEGISNDAARAPPTSPSTATAAAIANRLRGRTGVTAGGFHAPLATSAGSTRAANSAAGTDGIIAR
jgi:hypothetical protein